MHALSVFYSTADPNMISVELFKSKVLKNAKIQVLQLHFPLPPLKTLPAHTFIEAKSYIDINIEKVAK